MAQDYDFDEEEGGQDGTATRAVDGVPMRTVAVVVPPGVRPGETKLAVRVGGDRQLLVTLPREACVGDKLILSRQPGGAGDASAWTCTVSKTVSGSNCASVTLQQRSGPKSELPGGPSSGEQLDSEGQSQDLAEGGKRETRITILVPAGIQGGSKLSFHVAGEKVIIPTPTGARPGDKLVLSRASVVEGVAARSPEPWRCTLVRDKAMRDEAEGRFLSQVAQLGPRWALPPAGLSTEEACQKLFVAARAAGMVVSEKLVRGSAPPLGIPGLLASAAIEKGEVLFKVPARFHITPSTVKQYAPALWRGVTDVKDIPMVRHMEVAQALFVADVLSRAGGRHAAAAACAALGEAVPPDVWVIWEAYSHVLLSEDFSGHPYLRSAADPAGHARAFEPSPEADFLLSMAEDSANLHQVIANKVPPADHWSGRGIEFDLFLQAKLSMLTRVFQTSVDSALVPMADLFNHAPDHAPGVLWNWSEEEQAMVVTALRAHAPGEELFVSYGPRSNQLLYRTYGFTVAPEFEPSWSYMVQPHNVRSIYDMYLPEVERVVFLVLDSKQLDEGLCKMMHLVSGGGHDVAECLRLVAARCMWSYEESVSLRPVLAALQRVRQMDPGSHAWWTGLDEADMHLAARDEVRVQMGEYLCLNSYLEAVNFFDGRVSEEECIREGGVMRDLLSKALGLLKEQGCFALKHVHDSCAGP